jgi:hypothetical protein
MVLNGSGAVVKFRLRPGAAIGKALAARPEKLPEGMNGVNGSE